MNRLNTIFIIYVALNLLLLLGIAVMPQLKIYFFFAELLVLLAPLVSTDYKKNKINKFLVFLFSVGVLEALLFASTRVVRGFFPGSSMGDGNAIGYSQYFNYSSSFDFYFFIVLVNIPIIISFVVRTKSGKNND